MEMMNEDNRGALMHEGECMIRMSDVFISTLSINERIGSVSLFKLLEFVWGKSMVSLFSIACAL